MRMRDSSGQRDETAKLPPLPSYEAALEASANSPIFRTVAPFVFPDDHEAFKSEKTSSSSPSNHYPHRGADDFHLFPPPPYGQCCEE
ncbi:unnamed protein product [Enterobius vermicularis]|uniref:Uncharacterized protein n=1 Tax=Enterobius vermicularis TaxID=51028 RepID=A0A0N4UXZ4_ENTVE|nr:unnamed protein product [Enterobius vermicularis]